MAALIGTVIAFATFGIVLKLAGARGYAPTPIAFTNYVFAAVLSLLLLGSSPESAGTPLLWLVGGAAGLCYVLGFFINYRAIDKVGLSVAQPVASVAVAVPILASIVVWGEMPTAAQTVALLAAGAALVLLSSGGGAKRDQPGDVAQAAGGRSSGAAAILAVLFLNQGLVMLAPKLVDELGLGAYRYGYLASLFVVATAASGWRWWRTRERLTLRGAGLGMLFGTANVAATVLLLAALQALPGILVYPVTSVGTMLAGAAAGMAVWSERPGRLAIAGMALAVPAVLLLNI